MSTFGGGRSRRTWEDAFVTRGNARSRIRSGTAGQARRSYAPRTFYRRQVRVGEGVELKFWDTYVSATSVVLSAASAEVDPTSDMHCLNAVPLGESQSGRIGRKIWIKSVDIKGICKPHLAETASNALPDTMVRIIIYKDKQTNGAQCNTEDVMQDTGGVDLLSHRNLQYSDRFTILFDKMVTVGRGNLMEDGTFSASISGKPATFRYLAKMNLPVTFSGDTADIANIVNNSIHVMAMASEGAGATISYQARVRYIG